MSKTDEDSDKKVVSVSEKGQATIPKELRKRHGISTPGKVRIRENDDGEIVVEPVPSLRAFRGAAETGRSGTEILREERERDRRRRGRDRVSEDGE